MLQENIVVYEALKNTALHCEDGVRSARLQMYTIYFAMLPFCFTYNWIFLVTFIVLIAFQAIMNTERIAIERISSYIRVFFEEERGDMHWSLLNKDSEHISSYSKLYKNLGWYIEIYASSILSVISFISMTVVYVNKNYSIDGLPTSVWIQIGAALLLCIVTIVVNSKYYDFASGKATITILDKSIGDFYKRQCEKEAQKPKSQPNPNEN